VLAAIALLVYLVMPDLPSNDWSMPPVAAID
jgi:hypothetical protein